VVVTSGVGACGVGGDAGGRCGDARDGGPVCGGVGGWLVVAVDG
jgi:hypothetical protein